MLLNFIFLGHPILFKQERIGKKCKPFYMVKFRSMTNKKDKEGNLLDEKQRLTKYGIFLRSTSLDELPELFNILVGNMSFIGPRPQPTYYLPYYYPNEKVIFNVKGGLIPPDSLAKKEVISWEEQFKYEIEYANHVTFVRDLKIIFFTFIIIIKRVKNKYGNEPRPHLNDYRKEDKKLKEINNEDI